MSQAIVSYEGSNPARFSVEIQHLRESLASRDLTVHEAPTKLRQNAKGIEAGMVVDLATMSLTAVSTLIAVVAAWRQRRPEYEVSISVGESVVTVSRLGKEDIERVAKMAHDQPAADLLLVISDME